MRRIVNLTSIFAGLLAGLYLAGAMRVYPEVIVGRSTWLWHGQMTPDWHYQNSRCSLFDIMKQGWTYRPQMLDYEEKYIRDSRDTGMYYWIIPLCMVSGAIVAVGLRYAIVAAASYARHGLKRLRHGPARIARIVLAAIAFLSLLGHVSTLHGIAARGGLGPLGLGRLTWILHDTTEVIFLPWVAFNWVVRKGVLHLDGVMQRHLSPAPDLCFVSGNMLWKGWLTDWIIVLVLVWLHLLILTAMVDLAAKAIKSKRDKSRKKTKPADVVIYPD